MLPTGELWQRSKPASNFKLPALSWYLDPFQTFNLNGMAGVNAQHID